MKLAAGNDQWAMVYMNPIITYTDPWCSQGRIWIPYVHRPMMLAGPYMGPIRTPTHDAHRPMMLAGPYMSPTRTPTHDARRAVYESHTYTDPWCSPTHDARSGPVEWKSLMLKPLLQTPPYFADLDVPSWTAAPETWIRTPLNFEIYKTNGPHPKSREHWLH